MIIDNIILFISIVNFILTLFVFLNAKELKQHIILIIFSFFSVNARKQYIVRLMKMYSS